MKVNRDFSILGQGEFDLLAGTITSEEVNANAVDGAVNTGDLSILYDEGFGKIDESALPFSSQRVFQPTPFRGVARAVRVRRGLAPIPIFVGSDYFVDVIKDSCGDYDGRDWRGIR